MIYKLSNTRFCFLCMIILLTILLFIIYQQVPRDLRLTHMTEYFDDNSVNPLNTITDPPKDLINYSNPGSIYERAPIYAEKYKKKMFLNDKQKLYKIGLAKDTPINREDCFDKCDARSCIQLDNMTKVLDKCIKCNGQKNKCFKKSIIGGTCDDCDESNEDKINCYELNNFGCANPNNLNDRNGTIPYYIEIPDNNLNSPYDKKCVFCWNILDNI